MLKSLPLPYKNRWGLVTIPIAVGIVTALGLSLHRPIGTLSHVFLYLAVIVLAAVWWSIWLALYACVLSLLAIDYFFVPPRGSLFAWREDYTYTSEILGLSFFVILAILITYLVMALKRERDRAKELAWREREAKEAVVRTSQQLERQNRRTSYLERSRQLLGDTIEPEIVLQRVLDDLVNLDGGRVILLIETEDIHRSWQAGYTGAVSPTTEPETILSRADMVLPLRVGGQLLGRLGYTFSHPPESGFSTSDSTLQKEATLSTLSALGEYIAISLENAKLYHKLEFQNNEIASLLRNSLRADTALSKRADQLSIFYRLSAAIISGIGQQDLLNLGLSEAARVLNCALGAVLVKDEQSLRLIARRGTLTLLEGNVFKPEEGIIGQVMASNKPYLSNRYAASLTDYLPCPLLAASPQPIRSCLYVPIGAGSEEYGIIVVGATEIDQYGREDLDFLTGLAGLLALAQVSGRYYREREHAASVEERNRIARELHDGLAQSINYIGLKSQLVRELYQDGENERVGQEIERIAKVAELARMDVREALYGLRHTERDRTFLQALADLVHNASGLSGIKVDLQTSGPKEWPSMTLTEHIQLLRIVQEALSNLQKHSRACSAQVSAIYHSDEELITLEVSDDGVGFVPEEVRPGGGQHLGLSIMKERAGRLEAGLSVTSQPGTGTKVRVKYRLPAITPPTGVISSLDSKKPR